MLWITGLTDEPREDHGICEVRCCGFQRDMTPVWPLLIQTPQLVRDKSRFGTVPHEWLAQLYGQEAQEAVNCRMQIGFPITCKAGLTEHHVIDKQG